jgi:hypothetical protein
MNKDAIRTIKEIEARYAIDGANGSVYCAGVAEGLRIALRVLEEAKPAGAA